MKYYASLLLLLLTLQTSTLMAQTSNIQTATFGAGCFWCTEAVYHRVNGIISAEAGYSGGNVPNPSYREVVSGRTGHVEVARITFDADVISYDQLLQIFWHTHNPTTLNRQGADVGTQYRSVIFYHNEEQKKIAEKSLKETDAGSLWPDPIVTAIEPLLNYFPAEDYHQDYYENNANAGYCSVVIAPKIQKLFSKFPDWIKPEFQYN